MRDGDIGASQPEDDAEMIALAAHILSALGVLDSTVLHLNSIGDTQSRTAFRDCLLTYFRAHYDQLSEDSKQRLEKNPLRILDSKDPEDKKLVAAAPKIASCYTPESADFFARLCAALDAYNIAYTITPTLVRGLDYYCHTTFEFITDALGAQGTVLGGGRYDGLAGIMGGQPLAAIGFASGVERLSSLCSFTPSLIPSVAIVPVGADAFAASAQLAMACRQANLPTHLLCDAKLAKAMKKADNLGAAYAVLLGSNEISSGQATVKCLADSSSANVAIATLPAWLADHLK